MRRVNLLIFLVVGTALPAAGLSPGKLCEKLRARLEDQQIIATVLDPSPGLPYRTPEIVEALERRAVVLDSVFVSTHQAGGA